VGDPLTASESRPLFEILPRELSPAIKRLLLGLYLLGAVVFVLSIVSRQYVVALAMPLMVLAPVSLRQSSRLRVIAYDDRLIIRNRKGQRTLSRDDVEFYVATPSLGEALKTNQVVGPAIYVRLRDGSSTPLQVTARKFPDGALPESLHRLQEWLLHRTPVG
jgi:hypothetical protein